VEQSSLNGCFHTTKNQVAMKHETIKKNQKSWALPGEPLTLHEFKKGIEEAEKGPFYSIEESKKIIAQWREARNF
jgi:hypothetical protein